MRVDTKNIKQYVNSCKQDLFLLRQCLVYVYIRDTILDHCANLFNCSIDHIKQTLIEENIYKYKLCTKCCRLVHHSNYNKQNNKLSGLASSCKDCRHKRDHEFYVDNKERITAYGRNYMQSYRQQDGYKEKHSEYMQDYKLNDEQRSNRKEYRKEYNQQPEIKKKNNDNFKKRYREEPTFRLRYLVSSHIYNYLNNKNGKSVKEILPYNMEELKCHLESLFQPGMTWDNHGDWHIDHIIPVTNFKFDSVDHPEFKECWKLSNLQPLWALDNIHKSNKL